MQTSSKKPLKHRWKAAQLRMARKARAFAKSQAPRKRRIPPITKARFLKALDGCAGNKSLIADRLGCAYGSVLNLLAREDWADMLAIYNDELEKLADLAEGTIKEAITQRMDMSTASRTAQWLLTRARHASRKMGDESKVVVEGGKNPILHQHNVVPIETLGLPVELRRQIMEHLDAQVRAKAEEEPEDKKKD